MKSATEIAELILEGCLGGCNDPFSYVDQLIEDGEIEQEDYTQQENDIWRLVDDQMFVCDMCGWNCCISELSLENSNTGYIVCNSCYEDEEEDA